MGGIPIPLKCFLKQCKKLKVIGDKQVWVSKEGNHLYTWDSLHGEIEVFNKNGYHLGVMDTDGNLIKPAVRGRTINV